jgi:hypothetical protein
VSQLLLPLPLLLCAAGCLALATAALIGGSCQDSSSCKRAGAQGNALAAGR